MTKQYLKEKRKKEIQKLTNMLIVYKLSEIEKNYILKRIEKLEKGGV